MQKKISFLNKLFKIAGYFITSKFVLRHIDGLKMYEDWARKEAIPLEEYCNENDPDIWKETLNFYNQFSNLGSERLLETGVKLGGCGGYPFLYFICRCKKPQTVIETGVAAGWSSAAILKALELNGTGKLYSTDLPYKKRPGAAEAIGILVEDKFRKNWYLDTQGDRQGLPKIVSMVQEIELFHFDSDKSYKGREYAFEVVKEKLADDAIIIFDDIQDNFHFKDLVMEYDYNYKVFEFERKFFGVIHP